MKQYGKLLRIPPCVDLRNRKDLSCVHTHSLPFTNKNPIRCVSHINIKYR